MRIYMIMILSVMHCLQLQAQQDKKAPFAYHYNWSYSFPSAPYYTIDTARGLVTVPVLDSIIYYLDLLGHSALAEKYDLDALDSIGNLPTWYPVDCKTREVTIRLTEDSAHWEAGKKLDTDCPGYDFRGLEGIDLCSVSEYEEHTDFEKLGKIDSMLNDENVYACCMYDFDNDGQKEYVVVYAVMAKVKDSDHVLYMAIYEQKEAKWEKVFIRGIARAAWLPSRFYVPAVGVARFPGVKDPVILAVFGMEIEILGPGYGLSVFLNKDGDKPYNEFIQVENKALWERIRGR